MPDFPTPLRLPSTRRLIVATVAVAVTAAAGTGIGVAASGSSPSHADLRVVSGAGGPMVVTGSGLTAYIYLPDPTHPSASKCTGDCANDWPPVLATSSTPSVSGIARSEVAEFTRQDGRRQLTLGGYPLYRFAGDHSPGDTYGESIGNTWFAVGPDASFVSLPVLSFGAVHPSKEPLQVVQRSVGSVVADSNGQVLYAYRDDSPTRSACTADWCDQDWPAYTVQKPIAHIAGIDGRLGYVRRPDGSLQLTLGGHPLYRFAGDTEANGLRGVGIGGDWYPVSSNGVVINK